MKTSSAKAKGRNLQKWVAEQILKVFPALTTLDVRSTSMGSGGVDVQLSTKAAELFPYCVETKNREGYKSVYDAYEQATSHGELEPLLIIKSNRKEPLVIISANHFFNLLKNGNTH